MIKMANYTSKKIVAVYVAVMGLTYLIKLVTFFIYLITGKIN